MRPADRDVSEAAEPARTPVGRAAVTSGATTPSAPAADRRDPDPARGAARRAAGDDRAPHAAAAPAITDRRLVLPGPLRPGRGRRDRRDERRAAPAHRAADGELALHRRDRAPRQRRQPRDGPARRAQLDDRRPRHQPLRGLHARHHHVARRPAVGGPAGRRPGRRARLRALRASRGRRSRLGGPGVPRLAARLDVAGDHRYSAARRRDPARGRAPRWRSASTRRTSTGYWSTPGSSRWTEPRSRGRAGVPARRLVLRPWPRPGGPAARSSAARRSGSRSSCGGTSSAARTRRSSAFRDAGRPSHGDGYGDGRVRRPGRQRLPPIPAPPLPNARLSQGTSLVRHIRPPLVGARG